jgi:hypothetical protein
VAAAGLIRTAPPIESWRAPGSPIDPLATG